MSCKAPCNKYKEEIERLTKEVSYLKKILSSHVSNYLKNINAKVNRTLSKNIPKPFQEHTDDIPTPKIDPEQPYQPPFQSEHD